MDSLQLMQQMPAESVDLIVTSPPYALIKPKEYGNADPDQYVSWLLEFADEFWRILKPKGSFVLNVGGAYEKGQPTRSLCHFEVLLALCKRRERKFHLAQELYWFNPAKMPAPAEWVTVRRKRIRDSVEPVWWLSKDPDPESNNRRVLVDYSPAMERLLKKGYNSGTRPSGHDVSSKWWGQRHDGAIPSNVLKEGEFDEDSEDLLTYLASQNLIELPNTSSNDRYRRLCKEHGVKAHPATFPIGLPRFFVKFLTQPGDIVFDPFGGSGTAGLAAQNEGRFWITCDKEIEYVKASRFRFPELDDVVE